jgi:hypothetical protein
MKPFPIHGKSRATGPHLGTLKLWFQYAPPKLGQRHWKSGRSAMELAKAWRCGVVPPEVLDALKGSAFERFEPDDGVAEHVSLFDRRRGEGRNHDLVLFGRIDGRSALIDIEGKADEAFDGRTVAAALGKGGTRARTADLCAALFAGSIPGAELGKLRYQLVVGAMATARIAEKHECPVALFLVHEFVNEACKAKNLKRNSDDLDRFLSFVDAKQRTLAGHAGVLGPVVAVAGTTWLGPHQEIYVGKAVSWQKDPLP